MDHVIYFRTTYIPFNIIDWLEKDQHLKDLHDFNWGWAYDQPGDQRFKIMFYDEKLALLTLLRWDGESE